MIIIWNGAGALVLIIGILAALLMNIITSAVFYQNDYFADHRWSQAMALWIAGAASWAIGRYLNRRPGQLVIDRATGQKVLQEPNHHLMFIKMEYWGVIFFVIGVIVFILGLSRK
jgi:hypothetical protein